MEKNKTKSVCFREKRNLKALQTQNEVTTTTKQHDIPHLTNSRSTATTTTDEAEEKKKKSFLDINK